MQTRHAARVLLLDPVGRVLVVRGHEAGVPDRRWWFTIGGGIDEGETPRAAAIREVREETGIILDGDRLEGPVLTRLAVFDFARERALQHEHFYLARLGHTHQLSRDGWTSLEQDVLDEVAWLSPDELRQANEEVFPAELPEIVEWLSQGWDGQLRHLGLDRDGAVDLRFRL